MPKTAVRKQPRYVTLSWTDPLAEPSRRHYEGSYREDILPELLDGLLQRGVKVIRTDNFERVRPHLPDGMLAEPLY